MGDYTVATGKSIDALKENVKALLEEGWAVQGGICIAHCETQGKSAFYQAMIKYAEVRMIRKSLELK